MCLFAKINIEGAILSQRGGPTLDSFAQSGPVSLKWIFRENTATFLDKKTKDSEKINILEIFDIFQNFEKYEFLKNLSNFL